jgi:uncharacterized delta-60 repeat protein
VFALLAASALLAAAPTGSSRRLSASHDVAYAVAIQPDGKIVAAGAADMVGRSTDASDHFVLARYTVHGRLDPSFGRGGKVLTAFGSGSDRAVGLAIQADGKIVAAGPRYANGRSYFALSRYTADGRLDPSFGSSGKVLTGFDSHHGNEAWAVAIQPDGKIVAAGGSGGNYDFALVRYATSGRLDRTFGRGGEVLTDLGSNSDMAYGVAIQANGKIVAAGQGGSPVTWALARYTDDGTLDRGFGHEGKVLSFAASETHALAVAIQANARIVAAGLGFTVARYTADGLLDPSFGSRGKVRTPFCASCSPATVDALAVRLQADGNVIAAGYNQTFKYSQPNVALARYTADGRLDPSFGRGGKVLTSFGSHGGVARAVAIQRDGKIVAAGASDNDFALVRYTTRGRLDPTFGSGGKVLTDFGSG